VREDFYFRLNVLSIELLPLRERIEDVPFLTEQFIGHFNREHRKVLQGVPEDGTQGLFVAG